MSTTPTSPSGSGVTPSEPVVYIVDDDASVRSALKRLFASVGLPVKNFASAAEFLEHSAHDGPQCLVLDVRMPGSSGLDLQEELNRRGIETPIIFITAHGDVPLTVRAMKAGAVELLTKPFDDQALLEAVQHALRTDRERQARERELAHLRERFATLTAREREVMKLVVTGMLNKQVAGILGTSEKTVKVHRARVMHKMDAASLAHLVRMADWLGISQPPGG